MRSRIVKIGNSRGVRIPKGMLEECGIQDAVELAVVNGAITLVAAGRPREGWAESAKTMGEVGDDALLDPHAATSFDESEWEW